MYKLRAIFRWLREDEAGEIALYAGLAFLVCSGCAATGYIYGYRDGRRD